VPCIRGPMSAVQNETCPVQRPWLFYTVAFDPPGMTGARQLAKMLAGSVLRSAWPGEMAVLVNAPIPLFMVPRAGLFEHYIETPPLDGVPLREASEHARMEARGVLDAASCEWVMFADSDCLCVRNLEHLLREREDADILYQPLPGRGVWQPEYGAYLPEEKEDAAPAKVLPSARCGITAGVWAVRGEIYAAVMEEWSRILAVPPPRFCPRMAQAAWNLLIRRAADHGWRARPFEPGEIAHPLLEAVPWQHYRDAALLHATGGALPERVEFLFGHYMQRYFYDPALTLLNVLET
jgi:hypothetical protein